MTRRPTGAGCGRGRSRVTGTFAVLALTVLPVLMAVGSVRGTGSTAYADAAPAPVGTPGYCRDDTGVTVVVDFSDLGGDIVVRCAPGPVRAGYTGVDALKGAGFTPTGTQRWGLAFVCRIQGRPSAGESLDTDGNPDYHERCVDTPPASAYWGYWYADNGGAWTYSSAGPKNRDAIAGGFEGWSFSLNHPSGANPRPGVTPTRPATSTPTSSSPSTGPSPGPSTTPTAPAPTRAPTTRTGPGGGVPAGGGPEPSVSGVGPASGPGGTGGSAQSPDPGPASGRADGRPGSRHRGTRHEPTASTAPIDPVASGQTDDGTTVTGDLPSADSGDGSGAGSSLRTFWGIGLLVALGLGAGAAAWRRSRQT